MTEHERILHDIKQVRVDANLSQAALGKQSGIKQSVISRIESGQVNPQLNTMLKLLTPLGKTLAVVDKDA